MAFSSATGMYEVNKKINNIKKESEISKTFLPQLALNKDAQG